ncbi:MAG: sugar transferase, partial [Gemmatimonadales bacterium]|nr:sugar transferase [Gemmatimonadales bacterium]
MSGARSSQPSMPAVTVRFDDVISRPHRSMPHMERSGQQSASAEFTGRALNFGVALVLLLLALPLLLVIALAVRCTSRGPVLYTQRRVGLD